MKKIAAFTLIELLIGMIISSIVIAFGYSAYTLIYKQYNNYKEIKEKMMEVTQLHEALNTDFHTVEMISFHENTLTFYKKEYPLEYIFSDEWIIRKERDVADTFRVAATEVHHTQRFPENGLFVQQFSFEVDILKEKEYFNFVKNYTAESLMNYQALNKNQ